MGGYAVGLSFDLFNEDIKEKACCNLADKVTQANYTVTTGFFGTAPLAPMLSRGGHKLTAYRLVTSTAYPSWLYPVTQGATTVWEHWDSFTTEKGFGGHNSMNSFNHYSFGSVLNWFYEYVLGIKRDINNPGYKHFVLEPDFIGFKSVQGGINSPCGRIESGYDMAGDKIIYRCTVPENSTATLILPNITKTLGSGDYQFIF